MGKTSRQFKLPDGRELGYDEHGPPSGRPVLLFHGTPGSRYGWHLFGTEALARRLNTRVISPDRPGVGLSDFQPGRRISDWPADVVALADGLGLGRFAVLGYSGGGPYALACALQIPEHLSAASIVGGAGPYDALAATAGVAQSIVLLARLAHDRPQSAEMVLGLLGALTQRAPDWLIAQAMAVLPQPDRQLLERPRLRKGLIATFREAVRQGPHGVSVDMALMAGPWGFDPSAVAMPVRIWHGEADRFASAAMARNLAHALPQGQARLYPGEGHLSILVNYREEILSELANA